MLVFADASSLPFLQAMKLQEKGIIVIGFTHLYPLGVASCLRHGVSYSLISQNFLLSVR